MELQLKTAGDFPDDLPIIAPEAYFCFDCGPHAPCFNRCCSQLALPLTPYDVLRLVRNLAMESGKFLRLFTGAAPDQETGFPGFHLRMSESSDAPCPFVTVAGCQVYEDRPGACRSYPLGRGAKLSHAGVEERFFLIREDHCKGFDAGEKRQPAQWFQEQGLTSYNDFNDRYMRLLTLARASGRPLEERMAGMATLCLWQIDHFRQFLAKMKILKRVAIDQAQAELIADNSLAGDEACLDFGLKWLELMLFGKAEGLQRKDG